MEEAIHHFVLELHWTLLALMIAVSLAVLGKAADLLVDEAVALSERSGIPKAVVGATIVSLGTTAPEVAVSVFAAIEGRPGLALGNAVGSVICDTGLILGLACLVAPLRLDRKIVNRQGWMQIGAAVALVAACFPWMNPSAAFSQGGNLPRFVGFIFLAALALYLWQSIRWARAENGGVSLAEHEGDVGASLSLVVAKLLGSIALVVGYALSELP